MSDQEGGLHGTFHGEHRQLTLMQIAPELSELMAEMGLDSNTIKIVTNLPEDLLQKEIESGNLKAKMEKGFTDLLDKLTQNPLFSHLDKMMEEFEITRPQPAGVVSLDAYRARRKL